MLGPLLALALVSEVLHFDRPGISSARQFVGTAGELVDKLRAQGMLEPTDRIARTLLDRPVLLEVREPQLVNGRKILAAMLHGKWKETKTGLVLELSAINSREREEDLTAFAAAVSVPTVAGSPHTLEHLLISFARSLGGRGVAALGIGSTATYSTDPRGIQKPFPPALGSEIRDYQEMVRQSQGVTPEIYVTCSRAWFVAGLRALSIIPTKGVVETSNLALRLDLAPLNPPESMAYPATTGADINALCRFILERPLDATQGRAEATRLIPKPYAPDDPVLTLAKPLLSCPTAYTWFGIAPSDRWIGGLAEALLLGGTDARAVWSRIKTGVSFVEAEGGLLVRPMLNTEFAAPHLDRGVLRNWLGSVLRESRERTLELAVAYYLAKDSPLSGLYLLRKLEPLSVSRVRSEGLFTALALVGSFSEEQRSAASTRAGAMISTERPGQVGIFRSLTEEAWGEFDPSPAPLAARSSALQDSELVRDSRLWLSERKEIRFSLDYAGTLGDPLTYSALVTHLGERCRIGNLAPDESLLTLPARTASVTATTLTILTQGSTAKFDLGVETVIADHSKSLRDIPQLKDLLDDVKRAIGTR